MGVGPGDCKAAQGCELPKEKVAPGRNGKKKKEAWKRCALVFIAAAAVWGLQLAHPLAPSSLAGRGGEV